MKSYSLLKGAVLIHQYLTIPYRSVYFKESNSPELIGDVLAYLLCNEC